MVGQGKRLGRVRPGSFVSITSQLVGRPYALCSACGGMDCFNLIYRYLVLRGYDLPTEYGGVTMDTYGTFFEEDPVRAKQIMVEAVASVLDEIRPAAAFAGDILLLALKDSDAQEFFGIHAGGANMICSSREHGVSTYPLSSYDIRRAFRCRQQSR